MQWTDRAIILSVKRLGEHSAVIHLLGQEQGLYAGVDRGAYGKRMRGIYQPGNIVSARWQARLSEHIGTLACELMDPVAAHLMSERRKLAALSSAAMMAGKMLAERERQTSIYERMEALLHALRDDSDWLLAYVMLEFTLLEQTGFGLDLASCAATGQAHDLVYISPKSGRAVSAEAGEPYREKLFRLPSYLRVDFLPLEGGGSRRGSPQSREDPHPTLPLPGGGSNVEPAEILDGLRICSYFLHERVFAPRGMKLPEARNRFLNMLELDLEKESAG